MLEKNSIHCYNGDIRHSFITETEASRIVLSSIHFGHKMEFAMVPLHVNTESRQSSLIKQAFFNYLFSCIADIIIIHFPGIMIPD